MRPARQHAFTLIELLVVVAIIALLISILLPSLNLAKKQAKTLVCNTSLKEQANAAFIYGEDNGGWMTRGMNDDASWSYAQMILSIIKPTGSVIFPSGGLYGNRADKQWDGRVGPLWVKWPERGAAPLKFVLGKLPVLQCPDFPVATQTLDYVSSAMAIPFTKVGWDRGPGSAPGEDPRYEGVALPADQKEYVVFFKITDLSKVNPGRLIWVTEAHKSLSGDRENSLAARFHHFFFAEHLPFSANPRIAADRRHPNGWNGMYFDGHVGNVPFRSFDTGYGRPLSERLRLFTQVPAELE